MTTEYETLLYDESDGVATITLNRPDKLERVQPDHERRARRGVAGAADER